jgi:hypothetical protein
LGDSITRPGVFPAAVQGVPRAAVLYAGHFSKKINKEWLNFKQELGSQKAENGYKRSLDEIA